MLLQLYLYVFNLTANVTYQRWNWNWKIWNWKLEAVETWKFSGTGKGTKSLWKSGKTKSGNLEDIKVIF